MTTVAQRGLNVRTSGSLDVVAGLWLIIAPFVLGYSAVTGAMWNDAIVGLIVAILAASQLTGRVANRAWPSWISVLAGLWLIISPAIIGYANVRPALWNDVIVGIIIVILAGLGAWVPSGEVSERDDRIN